MNAELLALGFTTSGIPVGPRVYISMEVLALHEARELVEHIYRREYSASKGEGNRG